MPFMDEINDVRDMVPAQRLPRPVLLGIVCIAAMVAILAALGVASSARGDFVVDATAPSPSAAMREGSSSDSELAEGAPSLQAQTGVFVYIVGAVKHPGVYELDAGARVNDAVQAAGGLAKHADAAAVNLARIVADGEQIRIPLEGEEAKLESAASAASAASPSGETGIAADGKVDINNATSAELESLPGIGEATAAKIIASRESEGPFATTEDLKRVSGIGDKKYASIADLVTV